MAENFHHHVVNEAQSMSAPSPIGDIAATSLLASAVGQQPVTLSTDPTGQVDAAETHVGEPIPPPREYAKSPLDKALLQAEASGGSDTDSGRKESSTGHARSNSVKKPTSFKSVSVTKSFLAKVVTGAQVARPGEKGNARRSNANLPNRLAVTAPSPGPGTPASAQMAKPRLVAKSTLGGLGSRTGASGNGGASGGPDASKVWNKNRRTSVSNI
jgi:hypothetical protein